MGIMTISASNNAEEAIRTYAQRKYGSRKGALKKAVDEAFLKVAEEDEQEQLRRRAIERLEKGFHLGRITYKSRDELYDERIGKYLRRH